jgi:translocation and assembly module TamA
MAPNVRFFATGAQPTLGGARPDHRPAPQYTSRRLSNFFRPRSLDSANTTRPERAAGGPRGGAVRPWQRGATIATLLLVASAAAAEVEVSGVDAAVVANVLAYLDLDEEPCDAPRWRVEQLYRGAPGRIRDALQAFGYYEPSIAPELDFTEQCWRARFMITAGEPVRIRSLDLALTGEAERDAPFAAALEQAGLTGGAVLNHGAYDQLKRRWSDLARERGYAEAQFAVARIDVYPEEHVADIALRFDSGVRYAFGRTELTQDVLTGGLAASYLDDFREGEPYDAGRLTDAYAALASSGYFETIDVRPMPADATTRTIPVAVTLTSSARMQTSYGIGYQTDTGPRFRFARTNRRVNDRGHQLGINLQLSPVISELTTTYRMPLRDSRSEWLAFDAGIEHEDTETSNSERIEFGARRVHERRDDWTRTELLSMLFEDFIVAEQSGRSRLLMPGVSWVRIRADNEVRPRVGSKLSLEVRGANDGIISDTSFVQTIAQGVWIWSRPSGQRFLVRGQAGTTAMNDFAELPASVRFFAGGDNSVRGYGFEELGPIDADGNVIGGSSLLTGSFEFEQPLRERWSLAFFVDAGNAFESSNVDAKTGVGIGGRWISPLGPIRIDLAVPLDDETEDFRFHFSLGPDL